MPIRTITPHEAYEMMQSYPSLVLLDVRRPDEFAAVRIPDAINIPLSQLSHDAPRLIPRRDSSILVYCRSGMRSRNAVQDLEAMGYTNIYDLGGILSWPYEKILGS